MVIEFLDLFEISVPDPRKPFANSRNLFSVQRHDFFFLHLGKVFPILQGYFFPCWGMKFSPKGDIQEI
jgi:hypothetical protein